VVRDGCAASIGGAQHLESTSCQLRWLHTQAQTIEESLSNVQSTCEEHARREAQACVIFLIRVSGYVTVCVCGGGGKR
jgi:hypothetical protein